ncbi:MAG: B12-binding domain-containing radical SAM protein [Candidatus Helarchaeota archaeon]
MKIGMVYTASIAYELGGGPPYEYAEAWTPLGIAYPLAIIKMHYPQIRTEIIDQAILKCSADKLLEYLLTEDFDVLGFSSYVWNATALFRLISGLKKERADLKIVVGGPFYSYLAHTIMARLPSLDFIIQKEGEIPFLRLIHHLQENDSNYQKIPNLIYRANGKIFENAIEPPPRNLDEYTSPYLTGILDCYLKDGCQHIGIQTSRGCPFQCQYCAWNCQSTYEGLTPRVRYFTIERVLTELKYIKKYRKRGGLIEIYDATFNENTARFRTLCQAIVENQLEMSFAVRIRADLLNDEQIDLLHRIGTWIIKVGIESSGECLTQVNRVQSNLKIEENLRKVKESGIRVSGNIMIGLPGQRREEVLKTIEMAERLELDMFTINIFDPPPSSEIYTNPESYGLKRLKETVEGRRFFETQWLSRDEIIKLGKLANQKLNSAKTSHQLKESKTLMAFL